MFIRAEIEESELDKLLSKINDMTIINPSIIPNIQNTVQNIVEDKYLAGGIPAWSQSERAKEDSGMTLQDTGQLAASLVVNVAIQNNEIEIQLNEKYYGIYHEYGAIIPVTQKSRKFFWAKYKETGKEFWKKMALTKKSAFVLPPRPHLALTQDDIKTILAEL